MSEQILIANSLKFKIGKFFLLFLLLNSRAAIGQNLLLNGSFETGRYSADVQ
ncbi:MAG: hypothetical protein RLZZ292_2752 [Bacteroidota bacterium]|jgi:hypothetical protein